MPCLITQPNVDPSLRKRPKQILSKKMRNILNRMQNQFSDFFFYFFIEQSLRLQCLRPEDFWKFSIFFSFSANWIIVRTWFRNANYRSGCSRGGYTVCPKKMTLFWSLITALDFNIQFFTSNHSKKEGLNLLFDALFKSFRETHRVQGCDVLSQKKVYNFKWL